MSLASGGSLSKPDSIFDPNSGVNPVGNLGTQPPIGTPIVLAGVKAQTGINQLRGSTVASSTGIGIPKQVTNISVNMSNASKGSTSLLTITFQRDPSDKSFSGVTVYVRGYQGNQTPTQIASGTDSPLTVILNNTGESISVIVQAQGNGGSAPLATAPTTGLTLPKNSTGGFGTSTTTNLTATQVQAIAGGGASGSLTIAQAAAPATVNLTTEGTFDWFMYSGTSGTSQQLNLQLSFLAKTLGGGFYQRTLSAVFTQTGGAPAISVNTVGGPIAFSAAAGDCTHPDGISAPTLPLTSFAPYTTWVDSVPGFGYQFSVDSNSVQRILRLYCGGGGNGTTANIRVTAHLMDGSAPDQSVNVLSTLVGAAGPGYQVTITYKSANPTKLLVTAFITSITVPSNGGFVSFFGATIA